MQIGKVFSTIIIKLGPIIFSGWTETVESYFLEVGRCELYLIESEIEFQKVKKVLERNDHVCFARSDSDHVSLEKISNFGDFILYLQSICKRNGLFYLTVQQGVFTKQNVFSRDCNEEVYRWQTWETNCIFQEIFYSFDLYRSHLILAQHFKVP